MRQLAMLPEFAPTSAPLSKTFSGEEYRVGRQRKPRWTSVKVKKPPPCDECFALQHETRGAYGWRSSCRHRRTLPDGPTLLLCNRHTNAWLIYDCKHGAA